MFMTELRYKIGLRIAEKAPKLVNRKRVGNKMADSPLIYGHYCFVRGSCERRQILRNNRII